MPGTDDLDRWIDALRDRVISGDLADAGPISLGYGLVELPAEVTIKILLAELDDLDDPDGSWLLDGGRCGRRRLLMDDFGRLRDLIG